MKKTFKNKKGFTLIEIVVVLAILAILVAVAIPVYNNTTLDAHQKVCDANIRIIKSAIVAATIEEVVIGTDFVINSQSVLAPYIYDIDSMICPSCNKNYEIDANGAIICPEHS